MPRKTAGKTPKQIEAATKNILLWEKKQEQKAFLRGFIRGNIHKVNLMVQAINWSVLIIGIVIGAALVGILIS